MSDDSDGEGFCDDPFDDVSDGDDSCGNPFGDEEDDDGCLGLCGDPSDEEGDDDSNGEEMCEVPCCYDEDEDSYGEDLCLSPLDDDDGESEEALSDDDDEDLCLSPLDDDDGESEEGLSDDDDEEGNGEELVDDPCDEDDEESDGEAEDLFEDLSSNNGEEGERELFCVSGVSTADGTHISDSVQYDTSSSEYSSSEYSFSEDSLSEEDVRLMPIALPTRPSPAHWTLQMLVDAVAEHNDSDEDIDYDSDGTDYELHRLPASRAAVESLPEATLGEEEVTCGCAVCKDDCALGQRVVWLPCKHYFHDDCIQPWLAIRSTCPVCRYQLPTDDAESRQARRLRF